MMRLILLRLSSFLDIYVNATWRSCESWEEMKIRHQTAPDLFVAQSNLECEVDEGYGIIGGPCASSLWRLARAASG
jgi:hypothetical protein